MNELTIERANVDRGAAKLILSALTLPTLSARRHYSQQKIKEIKRRLCMGPNYADVAIAAVGSLGRLEASSESDFDYILISSGDHAGLREQMDDLAVSVGLKRPNPRGVFTEHANIPVLTERIGRADDSYENISHRMLLLLESHPIYNDTHVHQSISLITDAYLKREKGRYSFSFLLNDLNRYFRTICVNNESNLREESQKWGVRNIKLKHSRIIMHCGLLFLIAESSGRSSSDAYDWFCEHLPLTPLERIAAVYKDVGDPGFGVIAGAYNKFLESLSDRDVREVLNNLPYEDRYANRLFMEFQENSKLMTGELYRFLFTHGDRWGPRFLSKLVF